MENAATIVAATGGSTNAGLHLPAIANEIGIKFDLMDVAKIFKRTPYLADLKPGGKYVAKDMWEATVSSLNTDGDLVRIGLNGSFFSRATITDTSFKELGIELGSHCWASIKATELMVLPSMDPDKK